MLRLKYFRKTAARPDRASLKHPSVYEDRNLPQRYVNYFDILQKEAIKFIPFSVSYLSDQWVVIFSFLS